MPFRQVQLLCEIKSMLLYTRLGKQNPYRSTHSFQCLLCSLAGILNAAKGSIYSLVKLYFCYVTPYKNRNGICLLTAHKRSLWYNALFTESASNFTEVWKITSERISQFCWVRHDSSIVSDRQLSFWITKWVVIGLYDDKSRTRVLSKTKWYIFRFVFRILYSVTPCTELVEQIKRNSARVRSY
jgi:hypothetical protein